jgi:hypothetical protein
VAKRRWIRRLGAAIVIVAFLGIGGVLLLSQRAAIDPVQPPAVGSFSAESIARGEALAAIGHCASCHTGPGGQLFAGGYGVNTPFGVIYGTNITPNRAVGIGSWSLAAFVRAMREGVPRWVAPFPCVPLLRVHQTMRRRLELALRIFDDPAAS